MKNILVTGGAGFIGSQWVRTLLNASAEPQVVTLDVLTYAGHPENLEGIPDPDRHQLVQGDIRDRELVNSVLKSYEIDTIVHFAAESHVDWSIASPHPFASTNVLGTLTLLEAARQVWMDRSGTMQTDYRFHHISTDEVYGSLSPEEPAWTEESCYAPNSPYAATKAASDHLVRSFGHTYNLPYTITNCSNNYGPRQHPEKLIPHMILCALEGKPMPVYGDGQQIRDWLFVEDHCQAIWKVLTRGKEGETYNVGGEVQITNLTVVKMICGLLDEFQPDSEHRPHQGLIQMVEDRLGHDRRYALDITKIRQKLKWEPTTVLEEGSKKTVRWYLDHPQWVEKVLETTRYRRDFHRDFPKGKKDNKT